MDCQECAHRRERQDYQCPVPYCAQTFLTLAAMESRRIVSETEKCPYFCKIGWTPNWEEDK